MRDIPICPAALLLSLFLACCGMRTGTGPRASDAPNTGLNAIAGNPFDSAGATSSRGSAPDEVSPGAPRTSSLSQRAEETRINVADVLASAATPPSTSARQAEPADAGAPDGVPPAGDVPGGNGTLPALPDGAPNTGLAALSGEGTGDTGSDRATPAADAAAKEREEQVARLAGLRRDLRTFLDARRQQGAGALADASAAVVGDAIGYEGDSKPAAIDEGTLTSQERTTLSAVRALGAALGQEGKPTDPVKAARLVEGVLGVLREGAALRIATAALCTRVNGFGQYEPFAEYTFLAGRTTRMIVYAEVENFGHRAAHGDDPGMETLTSTSSGYVAVELSQELRLWHDADGSMQWRKPEQTVIEVGRNKRRDFYLVQQVELPPTLSVGKYNLKVTIRDKVTGSVDERSIPIKIVADAGVLGRK